jgi:hypothetical protein
MKRMVLMVSMTVFLLVSSLTAFANDIGTSRLSFIEGDVVVLTQDTGNEWVAASINIPLLAGDRVWVPQDGRAEIQFIGRTYLRADGNTEVSISKAAWERDSRIVQTAVPEGRIYINYRSSPGRDSVFQVDTPLVSVMAYDDARYDIQVWDDGYTEVAVLGGVVHVESPNGNTRVTRGNMISIGPDSYADLSPLGPRNEWVRWNQSRDSQLVRYRTSSRYLPPELDVYSNDFDQHGRWIYERDYGYVWNPTIVVSGWAPYRHGRWVWRHGDYVWVSYEPWGWAPYHYGRWAFRIGIGWFWVPPAINAVFWSPGFVAWIYTPTYVSWVPLAPREVYYGYGNYGPHSVNLTTVNIKNVNVTNVYVNSRVTNAVTVVHHDTFLTGKQVKVAGKPANPFLQALKVSPGRPDIRPVKATVLPLPEKSVPMKALPSQRVVEKLKRTGIDQRPVAVKKDTSVFKQGRQVTSLPVTRSDKPKPVMRDDRHGKGASAGAKEGIHVQPKVEPKEPVRKPLEQPVIKERRSEQKPLAGKPVVTPREDSGRGKIQTREAEKQPVIQPSVKERPVAVPRERTGGSSVKDRGTEKPKKKKELKDVPSVTPKGEVKNVPERPGEAKNIRVNQKGTQDKQIPDPRSQGNY